MSKQVEELENKLRNTISTVTSKVDETVKLAEESSRQVESKLIIPQEIKDEIIQKRSWFHDIRRKYPWEIIGASAISVGLVSLPFGRSAFLRNGALAGFIASTIVAPEKLVNTFHKRSQYYP